MKTTLLTTLLFALPALAGPATMEDLQALATTSSWDELLDRAQDIPAATRTQAWRDLVTSAATAAVQTDESRAPALASRFPFLSANPAFAKAHGSAAVTALERCLRDETRERDVLGTCLATFRKTSPSPQALLDGAKVVRRTWNAAAAIDLYAEATKPSKDACADAGLLESTLAALELPASEPRAKTGRTLAFETCWAAIAPGLKTAMVHASPYLLRNACAPLRAKKALTEMQDELCRDEGQ